MNFNVNYNVDILWNVLYNCQIISKSKNSNLKKKLKNLLNGLLIVQDQDNEINKKLTFYFAKKFSKKILNYYDLQYYHNIFAKLGLIVVLPWEWENLKEEIFKKIKKIDDKFKKYKISKPFIIKYVIIIENKECEISGDIKKYLNEENMKNVEYEIIYTEMKEKIINEIKKSIIVDILMNMESKLSILQIKSITEINGEKLPLIYNKNYPTIMSNSK